MKTRVSIYPGFLCLVPGGLLLGKSPWFDAPISLILRF
jgi:hypothetical protein